MSFCVNNHRISLIAATLLVMAKAMALKSEIPYRMGLGLAALGRPGYINLGRDEDLAKGERSEAWMQERAFEVLDAAIASGVRWFDAARSYGLAEQFLGDFLRARNISKDEVFVSSKWGYRYAADWRVTTENGAAHEIKDHSLQHLRSQVKETESCLGSYVNLYQIHSATFESGVLENEDVLRELETLKSTKGWKIGLSVSSPSQSDVLRVALGVKCSDGSHLFDSCQVTYNVLEQTPFDALVEAHEAGLFIIVKEALANGRALKCEPLLEAAERLGESPDTLALAAVIAAPFKPHVLSGAVTTSQLDSNLRAKQLADKLSKNTTKDESELDALLKKCRQDSASYWSDRSQLAWN